MNNIGIIERKRTALLIIDYQKSLMPFIHESEDMIANGNRLIKGADILKVTTLVTEQYPKGLGHTCEEIELSENQEVIEKISFSCMLCTEVEKQFKRLNIKSIIIAGIEAHICVLKTALDALAAGYEVHVVADAISSRTQQNKLFAIERMRQAGAFIVTTEMILFQLMDKAGSDEFKLVSKLIK